MTDLPFGKLVGADEYGSLLDRALGFEARRLDRGSGCRAVRGARLPFGRHPRARPNRNADGAAQCEQERLGSMEIEDAPSPLQTSDCVDTETFGFSGLAYNARPGGA